MLIKILKNKVVIISSLVAVCLISFIAIYFCMKKSTYSKRNVISSSVLSVKKDISLEKIEEYFTVEVKGQVVNPGVYKVNSDSRVIDVVNLAGGLTDNANTRYINLSKKITDEMSIIIYSNDEINKHKENNIVIIEEPCVCSTIKNDACLKDVNDKNLISLNTATKEELQKIPGIGSSKADSIIQYRETNKFTKIEDVINVKGIGQALFDTIKEYIAI